VQKAQEFCTMLRQPVVEKDERPGKRRLRHRTSNIQSRQGVKKQTSTLGTFLVYPDLGDSLDGTFF
jgi:hypothetical protein